MEHTLSHLACSRCHLTYSPDSLQQLCTCESPLLPRYDLQALKRRFSPANLAGREPNLWRYREVLPVEDPHHIISMGEGFTPLYSLPRLAATLGMKHLFIKDESYNPGGTFKARGAAVGISRAVELGARTVAIATNGNAGEAWAIYGARAGIETVVIMPADAEEMPQKVCAATGARAYLVQGLISDAARIVQRGAKRHGWYDGSTFKEPYRIEGKKTTGYEILEQMNWNPPDAILFPTGGGMMIAAVYKAFLELQELGWIEGPLPRLIAVQSTGCDPLVRAFAQRSTDSQFFEGASTCAIGLRVPKSFGDFLVLDAIYSTGGTTISVPDEEIRKAVRTFGQTEGLFVCPEAAAVLPGLRQLLSEGRVLPDERVVLIGTGSGFKYPGMVSTHLETLPVESEL